MSWRVGVDFARKMLGQRSAKGLRRCLPLCRWQQLRLFHSARGLQVFELKLHLLDLAKHLLALASKEHVLQLRNQKHQPFDLDCTGVKYSGLQTMLSS